jgi:integrase
LDPDAIGPLDPALRAALISLPGAWAAAYAPDTITSRRTDLRRLNVWCQGQNVFPFAFAQALPDLVHRFLVAASENLSPASLRRVGGSLSALLRGLGVPDTLVADRHRMTLRACNRQARARPGRSPDMVRLTASQIGAIEAVIQTGGNAPVRRARDLAMVRIMAELMLRRSELRNFQLSDWTPETREILIRQSKTDQAGQGVVFRLGDGAVEALEAWLMISGLADIDPELQHVPLFAGILKNGSLRRSRSNASIEPLSGRSISRILKGYGATVGVSGVCGHTLRRSVARLLFDTGVEEEDIMMAGRWTSIEVMRSYVGQTPRRRSAAELLSGKGSNLGR